MFRGPPPRRHGAPVAGLVVGAMVGSSMARRSAQQQATQQAQQQQSQAELAQAQAEARYAQQQAAAALPVAQPVVYVSAPTQPAPSQAAPAPPSEMGRSMLNEALGGDDLELTSLQKQLDVTIVMCQQAMELYQKSMQMNKAAQRTNIAGVVLDRHTRAPVMDLAMDRKRDETVRKSTIPAEQASQMLLQGFRKIPDGLRVRYPAEMSRVGNVPEANLRVGSFGKSVLMGAAFGQTGQNVNDAMMAKKIAENEREIGACMRVVQEQIQLMQIVKARLDQDIAHARMSASAPAAVPVARPPPPPPAISSAAVMLQLKANHAVDEVAMAPYGIISVPNGAIVRLVQGTLEGGLGGSYSDYIEVDYNGKVGKISRLIVGRTALPPPAIY